jgi:DNA polymerase-3 subunit alpha
VSAVEEILRARDEGEFKSLGDFGRRVSTSKFNRRAWESLIKSGGFDAFGDRSDLLFSIDAITAYASRTQKDAASNQADLFGSLGGAVAVPEIQIAPAPTKHHEREQLQWERDLLGLYLSAHPLDRYDDYFSEQTVPIGSIELTHDKKSVIVGGVVLSIRTILTKSGNKMAFVAMEDKTGEIEIIVFPKVLETLNEEFVQDAVVKIKGKINTTDRDGKPTDGIKIIADTIEIVSNEELDSYKTTGKKMATPKKKKPSAKAKDQEPEKAEKIIYKPIEEKHQKIYVHVHEPDDHDKLLQLKKLFNNYPGTSEIILVLGKDKESAIRLPFTAETSQELAERVKSLYGFDCIKYV